jgi:hypothetical protein
MLSARLQKMRRSRELSGPYVAVASNEGIAPLVLLIAAYAEDSTGDGWHMRGLPRLAAPHCFVGRISGTRTKYAAARKG